MAIDSIDKSGGLARMLMQALTGTVTGTTATGKAVAASNGQYSADEQKQLANLQALDARVRHHDVPQKVAANGNPENVTYSFRMGPDGKRYAVSAEVGADPSNNTALKTPLQKAQQEMIDRQLGTVEDAGSAMLRVDIRV